MAGFAVSRELPGEARPTAADVGWREPVPFFDAVARAAEDGWKTRNFDARDAGWRGKLIERHERIAAIAGWSRSESWKRWSYEMQRDPFRPTAEEYEAEVEKLRKQYPEQMRGIPARVTMLQDYDQEVRRVRQRAEDAYASQPVAAFAGSVGSAATDPVNVAGGIYTAGWGAGRSLLARVGIQGAANAGLEVAQVPARIIDSQRFGPEYTAGEGAMDVVTAGIGGAALEGLGAGVRYGWRRFAQSDTPLERAAATGLDRGAADEATIRGLDGEDYDRAAAALDAGDRAPPLEPAQDLTTMFEGGSLGASAQDVGGVAVTSERAYRGRRIYAASFDPMGLQAAPRTFQYKADGDGQGVTARLKGVEAWDDSASGKVMVWQDEGGRLFVADGHQRRGLARRMVEKGFTDIRLDGMLFREADGWAARDVRTLAALKNIREGSGTILDAAKVFRDRPDALADRSLPLTGEFMAQARGLAKLEKDAFGAVVNKVIPERYGATIGEIAGHRQDLHGDMVKLLKEGEPANIDDARAMVVEALQDDWIRSEGDTIDLFGYDPAISAMASRAKVASAVKRALAKDQKLFGQLVRHADAIEAGGNALARDANEAALAVDRAALELVSKLALRHGPIGEAMGEAALKVARGEATPAQAGRGIVSMVRRAVAAGEQLNEARRVALDPTAPSPAAQDLVKGFDDYGGKAAADQAAFAPEDADLQDMPGLFDDLAETGADERAHARLTQCAPGVG